MKYLCVIILFVGFIHSQLVSEADVALDRCLSISSMPTVTDALKSNNTLLNLLRDASTIDQIQEGVQHLYKTVVDLTSVNQGFVTTAYVGFANDNVYGLRDCSLPENALLTGCDVEGSHWLALVRNTLVFSDQVRHRFSINSAGQAVISPMWNDTNPFMTTQRPWFTSQGWQFFQQSFASGLSTYALSVLASPGIVVAADRSWREPCSACLEESFVKPAVSRALDNFPSTYSPDEFSVALASLLGVFIESDSPSALQLQIGFNNGDMFLVKDCSQHELRDVVPTCSDTDRFVGFIVHHSSDTSLSYRLSLGGFISQNTVDFSSNVTLQPWFTLGNEQNNGFTHPVSTTSEAIVARSYALKFEGGVVSAMISERECLAQPSTTQELVADPANDECLSRSSVDESLDTNLDKLPNFNGLANLNQLADAVKAFISTSSDTAFKNEYATAVHYGTNNDEYFSIRPCSQPENRVQAGCDGVAYFSLYSSSAAIFGDKRLRIFPVTNNGNVNTSITIFASTKSFNLTNWLWYTQATEGTWTQRGGFQPSYTYSVPVTGGVWAIDRSYREQCNQCLSESVSNNIATQLMLYANGRQLVNISPNSFDDIIQKIWRTLIDSGDVAIQAYYGLWDGSFFMIKRCSAVEFNSESPCSTAAPFTAWILRRDVFGDFKRRVFNLDNNGALTESEIYTSGDYFPTSRPWYQIGRTAGSGWSGVFAHHSSSMSGRTFAQQFNEGVIGVDFTTRECEPAGTPTVVSSSARVSAIWSFVAILVCLLI